MFVSDSEFALYKEKTQIGQAKAALNIFIVIEVIF